MASESTPYPSAGDTSSSFTSNGMAPATTWQPDPSRKRKHRFPLFLIALFAAAYAVGIWFFGDHFTPGTTVDGIDASLMTTTELESALQKQVDSYSQHITGGDGFEMNLSGADIGLTFDCAEVAQKAREESNAALWLPYLIAPRHMLIDGNIQVNEEQLTALVTEATNAYNSGATSATDATAGYDAESKTFVVTEESEGTQLLSEPIVEASKIASRELRTEVTLDDNSYIKPNITSDDETLNTYVKKANKILEATPVEIVAGDDVIATIDTDTVASFISSDENGDLEISGIYNWVENNEAVTDAGNASDDQYVWAIDVQGTTDDIHRVLEDDLGKQAEVVREVIETKPEVTEGAKERGRHLDVNLSTQYIRFYDTDGTVIWESYCVSGGYDLETGEMHYTPTGEYAIETKETNRTLIGADRNGDGEPDYESFVYYWMPFLSGDWGLHDATWRSDFGPGINGYWGSHGCINLPYYAAEELFNLIYVGDIVSIHY